MQKSLNLLIDVSAFREVLGEVEGLMCMGHRVMVEVDTHPVSEESFPGMDPCVSCIMNSANCKGGVQTSSNETVQIKT